MATSPTQRSLAHLRGAPYFLTVAITERWNPFAKIRQDLFGFADLVGIGPDIILACQTTTDAHVSHRREKILAEPRAKQWLEAGGKIVVHGWGRRGPRGKRKTWTLRAVPITLEDFANSSPAP